MKQILIIIVLFISTFSSAQIFHFDVHTAVLIKSTDESPAHWYLEIFNDIGIDSALRWKAHFDNVPSEWFITFDDQTTFHQDVMDGDSADFALPITGTFPQKLIIGAQLNNTPANAIITFEIYDPYNPSQRDTIGYEFYISQGTNNLFELQKQGVLELKNETIFIQNDMLSDFKVVDINGRIVSESKQTFQLNLADLKSDQLYFIEIRQAGKRYVVKWVR